MLNVAVERCEYGLPQCPHCIGGTRAACDRVAVTKDCQHQDVSLVYIYEQRNSSLRTKLCKNLLRVTYQYCIGSASIGNTVFSIARVLQYFLRMVIDISIADTFVDYWYVIYTKINSQ